MKLLITSDWHVDWVTSGKPRYDEVERAVAQTIKAAIENEVDHYFFLGDLMDPEGGAATLRGSALVIRTALTLSEEKISSHWLVGNHDVIEDGAGTHTLTPLAALSMFSPEGKGNIFVYEAPGDRVCGGGLRVVALPYMASSDTYNPEKFIDELSISPTGTQLPTLVIGHLSIEGAVPGEETLEMPRGRDVVFPVEAVKRNLPKAILFNGHYHRRQEIHGIHVPGSLARLTFGEVKQKPSFLLVTI